MHRNDDMGLQQAYHFGGLRSIKTIAATHGNEQHVHFAQRFFHLRLRRHQVESTSCA